jgi:hypothetical protein
MAVADRRITTSKRRFLREATYGCRRRFLMSQCEPAGSPARDGNLSDGPFATKRGFPTRKSKGQHSVTGGDAHRG